MCSNNIELTSNILTFKAIKNIKQKNHYISGSKGPTLATKNRQYHALNV